MEFNLLHCMQAYCPIVLLQLHNDIFICSDCNRNRNTGNQFPAGAVNYFILRNVRTVSGSQPETIKYFTVICLLGVKAAGPSISPFTFIWDRDEELMELYLHSQSVFVTRCLIKHTENFTFAKLKPAASNE